jgi:hypothetical protein
MISNIYSGVGITVGPSQGMPYVSGTHSDLGSGRTGELRLIGTTLNVFSDGRWIPINLSSPVIELSGEVQSILEWTRQRMTRERTIDKLALEHPSIQGAKDQLATAEHQLNTLVDLLQDHA